MDYKAIMNKEEDMDFPQLYENAIQAMLATAGATHLQKELKDKRDLGLKKYGEYSFQSSLKNALSTPTLLHIEEELIDAINYLAHECFKANFLYPQHQSECKCLINDLAIIYGRVECIINATNGKKQWR